MEALQICCYIVPLALIRSNSSGILIMIRKIYVYTFYRFKTLKNIKSIKNKLDILTSSKIIYGTVLIAEEGINGTISGTKTDLDEFIINLKRLLKIISHAK